MLSETLDDFDQLNQRGIDPVPAVGIEKTLPIAVGVQIEAQSPRTPEKINVTIAHTRSVKIDKAGKPPVIQHDVR